MTTPPTDTTGRPTPGCATTPTRTPRSPAGGCSSVGWHSGDTIAVQPSVHPPSPHLNDCPIQTPETASPSHWHTTPHPPSHPTSKGGTTATRPQPWPTAPSSSTTTPGTPPTSQRGCGAAGLGGALEGALQGRGLVLEALVNVSSMVFPVGVEIVKPLDLSVIAPHPPPHQVHRCGLRVCCVWWAGGLLIWWRQQVPVDGGWMGVGMEAWGRRVWLLWSVAVWIPVLCWRLGLSSARLSPCL